MPILISHIVQADFYFTLVAHFYAVVIDVTELLRFKSEHARYRTLVFHHKVERLPYRPLSLNPLTLIPAHQGQGFVCVFKGQGFVLNVRDIRSIFQIVEMGPFVRNLDCQQFDAVFT